MQPQIVMPDFSGHHNADIKASFDRLTLEAGYKDLFHHHAGSGFWLDPYKSRSIMDEYVFTAKW